jgi:cell division protein FtsI (penicillin-binding protein 3)
VQLAAAYGAIANQGLLLTPTLVREVRNASGAVVYRHRPEAVRRVVTPAIAAQLREFLRGAVEEGGTGEEAQLANYTLLGKTGTAIRFEQGRYVRGEYTASFAALFPADHPQLVVVVKIDNPRGKYYGGLTAAPVTRTMLQQALASRQVAIDRSRLTPQEGAGADAPTPVLPHSTGPTVVVSWPYSAAGRSKPTPVPVPDVLGRSAREAAFALHRRGLRVNLHGLGMVTRTAPAPGESAVPGVAVTVWTDQ